MFQSIQVPRVHVISFLKRRLCIRSRRSYARRCYPCRPPIPHADRAHGRRAGEHGHDGQHGAGDRQRQRRLSFGWRFELPVPGHEAHALRRGCARARDGVLHLGDLDPRRGELAELERTHHFRRSCVLRHPIESCGDLGSARALTLDGGDPELSVAENHAGRHNRYACTRVRRQLRRAPPPRTRAPFFAAKAGKANPCRLVGIRI